MDRNYFREVYKLLDLFYEKLDINKKPDNTLKKIIRSAELIEEKAHFHDPDFITLRTEPRETDLSLLSINQIINILLNEKESDKVSALKKELKIKLDKLSPEDTVALLKNFAKQSIEHKIILNLLDVNRTDIQRILVNYYQ